uniref:Uncharacterized protein n=1 Tax=Hyaloperonospora arabidopsidis (strain Emoy2) TaxID=559515 RepID=M4B1R2_HYAAE
MVVVSNAVVKMRSSIRSGFSNRERAEGSESYQLEHDPRRFITRLYHLLPSDSLASEPSSFMELPTYVVTYSTIGAEIRSLLADTNFVEAAAFHHSDVSGDADSPEVVSSMLVYKRAE